MLKLFKLIPKLPFSALVFYLGILLLWKIGLIPSPVGILDILEKGYVNYGLIGLFIASFLEGVVYFGLYFPGSVIIALAMILSDGSFLAFLSISLIVALALTLTSIINYFFGRRISNLNITSENVIRKNILSKGLIISMLHPNSLAFYFFNSGIRKHNILKVLLVPLIMIPYGLLLGYIVYAFRDIMKRAIESPYIMISIILFWMLISLIVQFFNSRNPRI